MTHIIFTDTLCEEEFLLTLLHLNYKGNRQGILINEIGEKGMIKGIGSIIGPIMIGPSSSHTAGAEKLGRAAYVLAQGDVKSVKFILHGSFLQTGKGHGTQLALLAGIMAISAYDERLKFSYEIAEQRNLEYSFEQADLDDVHPNTVIIEVTKSDEQILSMTGSSTGGGNIDITNINGIDCHISGDYPTVIIRHLDRIGVLSKITNTLEKANVNIVTINNSREGRGKLATTIVETDTVLTEEIRQTFAEFAYVQKIEVIDKL